MPHSGQNKAMKRPHAVKIKASAAIVKGMASDSRKRIVFNTKYPQRNCNEKLWAVSDESAVSLMKSRPYTKERPQSMRKTMNALIENV